VARVAWSARKKRAFGVFLVLIAVLGAYTAWDDSRFVVRTVDITHPQVPAAFDGYRIVQISDLHGTVFGPHQRDLLAAVAAARPDLILLTGDYTAALGVASPADIEPIKDLVAGLPAGVPVYYVFGNWDARGAYGAGPTQDNALTRAVESAGALPVYPYARIDRGSGHIWLTDWSMREFRDEASMLAARDAFVAGNDVSPERIGLLYQGWWARQLAGHDPATEFDVAVTHRPLDFPDYDAEIARASHEASVARSFGTDDVTVTDVDWDIDIAGHMHGGQMRIPFVGPVVTPEREFFPAIQSVEGTHSDAAGRITYISRGLGAGGPIPFMRFRLFNTPEFSVIVLHRTAAAS